MGHACKNRRRLARAVAEQDPLRAPGGVNLFFTGLQQKWCEGAGYFTLFSGLKNWCEHLHTEGICFLAQWELNA